MRTDFRLVGSIFLVGLSVVLFELTLTRIFSVIMWYHFASLSIAVAMFGFAAGGILVHLRPGLVSKDNFPASLVPWLCIFGGTAALPFGALYIIRGSPSILFPLLSFFHQPYYQPFRQTPQGPDAAVIWSMIVLYLLITVPFIAAGVTLAGLFLRSPSTIFGILYGADLAGAAAGCLILVPGLEALGAPSLLLAVSAFALVAASLLTGRKGIKAVCAMVALALVVMAFVNGPADRLVGMPFARGQYEPDIKFSRWNALSRVVVYPVSRWEAERAWGISRRYTGEFPENMGILVDDSGYTPIISNSRQNRQPNWAPYHIISLPYILRPEARTLIIGPGGGRDILAAAGNGIEDITAVELNPLILNAVEEQFQEFSGKPYSLPGVKTIVGEGRSELARMGGRFGIIQASSVFGEISPSAGAFSLSANFLYTREAFREYWDHLEDDGILSLSRTVFGFRALRLISLARDLLEREGVVEPESGIAVIRERGLATVMAAKGGFSESDIEKLVQIARSRSFTVEYLPGITSEGRFADAVRGEDVTQGKFDLSPPVDDRPFFYNNVPKSRFFNIFFHSNQPGERHVIVLRTMGIFFLALTALLLLVPFLGKRPRKKGKQFSILKAASFFAGIGLGYMVIELTMMHRLSLFLGHPTYSLTVVLAGILLSSGAGSLFAGRINWSRPWQPVILPVALILLTVMMWALAGLLTPSLGMGLTFKVALVMLLIAPPGLLMGIFMPMGLGALDRENKDLIPWAWALNGAASVAGSLGSLIVAMNFGYSRALLLGVISYTLTIPLLGQVGEGIVDARKEEHS